MQNSPDAKIKGADFSTWISLAKGNEKFIGKVAASGAAIMLLYTIVMPAKWKACATILTVLPSQSITGGSGASLASALSPNSPDPMLILESALLSREPINNVMKRTGFSRLDVEQKLHTEKKPKSALILISWEDTNRKRGMSAIEGALDGLTNLQHQIAFSTAALQAQYLEQSVTDQDNKLKEAEHKLAEFEKTMKAPMDPSNPSSAGVYLKEKKDLELDLGTISASIAVARKQAKAATATPELPTAIPNTAPFREKLISLEYDLAVAETSLGPLAPKVVALKRTIEVTRQTLRSEISNYLKSVDANMDPTIAKLEAQKLTTEYQLKVVNDLASRAPDEALTLARLSREIVILGQVSTALRAKWEEAKVEAKVDQVTWALLERPYFEDEPTNKHYARTPFIGAVLGAIFALLYLKWRKGKSNDTQANSVV